MNFVWGLRCAAGKKSKYFKKIQIKGITNYNWTPDLRELRLGSSLRSMGPSVRWDLHCAPQKGTPSEADCATRMFAKLGGFSYNDGMREYYVYILASKRNGTLYVGMTNDIAKRVVKHKGRRANQFAAKYDIDKLVYYEKHKSLEEAVKREKQVKKWRRQWKMKLIENLNPDWEDLFGEVIKLKTGSPAVQPSEQALGDRKLDKEIDPLMQNQRSMAPRQRHAGIFASLRGGTRQRHASAGRQADKEEDRV